MFCFDNSFLQKMAGFLLANGCGPGKNFQPRMSCGPVVFFSPYMPLVKFQWVSNVEQFFCGKESVGKDDFPRFIFLDLPRLMPRGSLID